MTSAAAGFRRQLPRNALFQVLSFIVQVAIGLCLVPYLVTQLGTIAFGLVLISGMLTQMGGLISHSISIAVSRQLTVALQQNDLSEASRVFTTSFVVAIAAGSLQILFLVPVLYFVESIVDIPPSLYSDTLNLLMCETIAYIVNFISSVFGIAAYLLNRIDISRTFDIGRQLLRVLGIFVLFWILGPSLRYVGYVDLGVALVFLPLSVVMSKRLAPWLIIHVGYFCKSKIRQILEMGTWLLVNNVGALLFLRMDVWVCNKFVSMESAGQYAALLQWPTLIRQGAVVLAAVTSQMIMIYFARGDIQRLTRLCQTSMRVMSLVITVPTGILCVCSNDLLRIWLGQDFVELNPVFFIMIFHLGVNVSVLPLLSLQVAAGKVRVPALVTLVLGICNLGLAILLASVFDLGIYGVAWAGVLMFTIKSAIFTPFYAAHLLSAPWHAFVRPYVSGVLLLGILYVIGKIIYSTVALLTLPNVLAFSAVLGSIGAVVGFSLLPNGDRFLMMDLLRESGKGLISSTRT